MDNYLWYSNATGITGPAVAEKLAEALGTAVSAVKAKPANLRRGDRVVCYGAKTSERTRFPAGVKVVNHPDAIRVNRNKKEALNKMSREGVKVPAFKSLAGITTATIKEFLNEHGPVVICRSNYHQAGRGTFLCSSAKAVKDAAANGAGYMQAIAPVDTEFRLHVTDGTVIAASKKVLREDPKGMWVKDYLDIAKDRIGDDLNEEHAIKILGIVAKDISFPDLLIRSHKRGWKFKRVNVERLNNNLKTEAVKAVESLGLNFGAVDCALTDDGQAIIVEVNSGPALQGNFLDKFVASIVPLIGVDNAPRREAAENNNVAEAAEAVEADIEAPAEQDNAGDLDLVNMVNQLAEQNRQLMQALQAVVNK